MGLNATLAAAAAGTATPLGAAAGAPWYYAPRAELLAPLSDKHAALLLPIAVYWLASAGFFTLDALALPFTERFRLHEPAEVTARNRVGPARVAVMVAVQQVLQTAVGLLALEGDAVGRAQVFADHSGAVANIALRLAPYVSAAAAPRLAAWLYWWGIPALQFAWAFFVMDAWQYGLHRLFHESRFLYRHFHSHHHRLYVPYAFGALYNHPVEGLLLDSAGGALAHLCARMTVRQGILLFTFSTYKTVCDHGGYAFPIWLDPLHLFFPNNAEYHDVHHQMQGLRYNFSQPFFVHFDVLFGTRMGAERFAKLKQASLEKRGTYGKQPAAASANEKPSASPAAATAAEPSPTQAADDLRRRKARVSSAAQDEVSVDTLLAGERGDPTVTSDAQSYRAKAGTAAA